MIIRCLFLLLSLLTLCACAEPSAEYRFDKERSKVVHRALKKYIRAMKETNGYHAAGIGEGLDHSTGKQNYIGVTFDIEHLPDVEFAREVEVEAIQEFLQYINSEEGIQDYLAEYPFPIKFVNIAFINKHREEGLFSVASCEDKLIYYKDNPKQPGPSIEVHRETYEEALRILAQQKKEQDVPLN